MDAQALRDLNISKSNFDGHLAARKAALRKVATMQGPLNGDYVSLAKQLLKAESDLEDRKNSVGGRPIHVYFENKLIFWVIVFVVACAEVLANKELFDMIFLGTALKSFFVALVLSVALISLAHWSGFSWRQIRSESEQRWIFSSLFVGLLTLAMMVITILGLMIVRAYFVNESSSTGELGGIFGGISEQARQLGLWGLIVQSFGAIEALALGVFNLMCVVVAWIIGFLSHDSDINYDKCYITVKKQEKRLDAKRRTYEKALDRVHGQYRKKIELARQAFMTARSHLGAEVTTELQPDNFTADRREVESESEWVDPRNSQIGLSQPSPQRTASDAPNVLKGASAWQNWGQKK